MKYVYLLLFPLMLVLPMTAAAQCPFGIAYELENASACSAADGDIDLTPTSGTPPFSFAWSNSATTSRISGLVPGVYTVTITDGASCVRRDTFEITAPPVVTLSLVQGISCFGTSDGILRASGSCGLRNTTGRYYQYRWYKLVGTTGTLLSAQTDSLATGLDTGSYYAVIRDANGDSVRSANLLLTQPARIIPSASVTAVSCNGTATGSVTLAATGGTGGSYTFALGAGAYGSSGTFNALAAGTYTFHVKDAAGCIRDTTLTITQPGALTVTASVTNITCAGGSNGSVILAAAGGTPGYTFARDAGSYTATPGFAGLAAGTYTFHTKDAASCIKDTVITLAEPARIVPAASVTNANCNGNNTGSVTLSAAGGTGASYTYAIGAGPYTSNGSFGSLGAGSYVFHIRDAASCVQDTTIIITEPAPLVLSLAVTNLSCSGSADGSVAASVTGGAAPYTYLWTNGAVTGTVNGLTPGTYGLSVTDANGCIATGTATVTAPDTIRLPATVTAPSCFGSCDGGIVLAPSGGTAPYTYSWSNGAIARDLTGLCAGIYTLSLSDARGCKALDSFRLTAPAPVTVNAGPDRLLCNTGTLTLQALGSDSNATYSWTSSIAGLSADSSRLVVSQPGTYYVTAKARGCSGSDTVVIGRTGDDFAAEFVAATQAFKDSVFSLVNISSPEPDTVIWGLPATPDVVAVSQSKYLAELIFRDTGVFTVRMTGRKGGCEKTMEDRIVVIRGQSYTPVAGNPKRAHIKVFVIAPNPSSGRFNVRVELEEEGPVRLRLLSLQSSGATDDRQDTGKKRYDFSYDLSLQSGQYLLLLETGRGSQSLKLVVQ